MIYGSRCEVTPPSSSSAILNWQLSIRQLTVQERMNVEQRLGETWLCEYRPFLLRQSCQRERALSVSNVVTLFGKIKYFVARSQHRSISHASMFFHSPSCLGVFWFMFIVVSQAVCALACDLWPLILRYTSSAARSDGVLQCFLNTKGSAV